MDRKTVIYTAIYGKYDVLQPPEIITPDVDYICFTNDKNLKSKVWKVVFHNPGERNNACNNRYLKLLAPFNELSNYERSLYIDGNIVIKCDLTFFLNKYKKVTFGSFKHPTRNCLFDEIEACLNENRGDKVGLFRQGLIYAKENMPREYGLSDNKILLRSNNDLQLKEIMYDWWHHVDKYSGRDQVCLPFVLNKYNVNYFFFDENIFDTSYFEVWPHRHEYVRRIWRSFEKYSINIKPLKLVIKKIKPRVRILYNKT